jgi:Mg-chelatase subunit ChlI
MATETEITARDFIQPDPDRLDREWIKQPGLYLKYAEKLADARKDFADAKAELEVVKAELSRDIRAMPETYGLKKVTESGIEGAVVLQKKHRLALETMNECKHRVDVLEAVVSALEHKKRALENLVTLHGQSYFATPRADGTGRESLEEDLKRSARKKRDRRGGDTFE